MAFGMIAIALWTVNRQLPGPPGWTWPELSDWVERQPVNAAFRAMSFVALTATTYLVVGSAASMVAAVARSLGRPRLARFAETLALPVLRRTVAGLLGLGLTVIADGSPVHALPRPAATGSPSEDAGPRSGVAIMRALDSADADVGVLDTTPDPSGGGTWTIQPGDHLWSLARRALEEAGHPPSDAEVVVYMRAVVEQNRHLLVVADEPDLVYPGQVFTRPPLP